MIRMVTRTVHRRKLRVMCLNTETGDTYETTAYLPREYRPKDDMKRVSDLLNSDTVKVYKIISAVDETTRYGMTEAAFCEVAEILGGDKENEEDQNISD